MLLLFFVASCIASFLQKKCFFSGKEAFVFSILRPPGRNSNCAPRPILAVSFSLLFGHEGRAKPPSRTYTKTLRNPQLTNLSRRNPILVQIGRIMDSGRKGLFWPFWWWHFPINGIISWLGRFKIEKKWTWIWQRFVTMFQWQEIESFKIANLYPTFDYGG